MSTADFINQDVTDAPLDPNSPEGKAFLAQQRVAAVGGSAILPGLASLVLPPTPPTDGSLGWKDFVPGIIPQAYNMLSGMKHLSGLAMQPLTGVPATGLPGSDTTADMAAASQNAANNVIPHMTPTTPQEQVASDMGNAAGKMGPFGLTKEAVDALPSVAKAVLDIAAPGLKSATAPVVGAGITGAIDAAQPAQASSPVDPYAPLAPVPPPTTNIDPYAPLKPTDPYAPLPAITNTKPGLQGDQDTGSTLGKIAMYGAASLIVFAGGRAAIKFVDELAGGLRDSWYAGDALRYNNAEAGLKQGAYDAPHVEAPLPVNTDKVIQPGSLVKSAQTYWANSNARLQAYSDAVAVNKTEADQMRAETGLVNNASSFNGRVADIATTGIDKTSGVVMPSAVDHWQRVSQFTPAQTDLFNRARYAANELDNRSKLYSQAVAQPTGIPGQFDDANFRVNFPYTDSAALRQAVSDARADPIVANELDTINTIHRQMMTAANASDFISNSELRSLINDHPNYLASSNTDGTIISPFSARNTDAASGLTNIPIHASELDKQHFTSIFRSIENNSWTRHVVDMSTAYQDANPDVAQIFQPNFNTKGEWVKPDAKGKPDAPPQWVAFRRNGATEFWNVGNAALARDLQSGSSASGPVFGALNYAKNIFQSAVTGPISMVGGHFFPAINATRNTLLVSAFRPAGTTYGPITGLIHNITGGVVNPRGLLPDAVLGTLQGLFQGLGAEGAHALASIFDASNPNAAQRLMQASLGPTYSAAIHQRLQAAWDTSIRAEMKANGTLGSVGYASTELPAKQYGARNNVANPLNNLVPALFRVQKLGAPGEITNFGYDSLPIMVKMQSLYQHMQSIVNEAAQTHFYSTNKGRIAPDLLSYETRQLTGDPGTHGSGTVAKAIAGVVPYSNIIVQDLVRMGRSFAETPISNVYGIISAMGTLALGSIYTASLSGPAAMNHLTNELSNDQKASQVHFYIPGIAPESSPTFDLLQRVRWMYPLFLQAAYDALNVQAAQHTPQTLSDSLDWLHSFFNKHITAGTVASTIAGISDAVSPGLPSPLNAAFNLAGQNVNPTLYNQTQPGNTAIMPVGGDMRAPGHLAGSDPLTGSVTGARISHAISSSFGIAGSALMTALNSIKAGEKAHNDPMQILGVLQDQWLDRLKDSVPFLKGTVFANNSALSAKSPLIERTEAALDAMRPTATWKSDAKYGATDTSNGYTRAHGQQLSTAPLNPANTPTDPTMAKVYDTYGAYTSFIEKKMMPPISDIRKQMNALVGSPLPPEEIRAQHNAYQRQLQTKYEALAGIVNDADSAASKIIGKPVSILHIDFNKGPEQFNSAQ